MIDADKEHLLTYKELARILPVERTICTINRWVREGVVIRTTGKRVFLDTVRFGGRRLTSVESYKRFMAELNEGE